jgi:exopolysaccharide biosynthesis polyprenyl glycosylphosphotransferase
MIEINPARMTPAQAMLKRSLDIVGAIVGLFILSPLFLVISIMVKLTSRGPIFYSQTRMSLDGQTFKMWKFRSMKVDAEKQNGAQWAKKDDDRRTPIGTFLRKTSLDEIPQFWNVLIGDMSLVGPRPERPVFIERFKDQIPSYMLRHRVKAGITGWAQVNGWRGDTSIEKRIEFDIYYIKHWSLWFDIRILLLTFVKGFVHQNAY